MATSSPSQSGRSMRHNIITVIIACLVGLALMEGGVRIWAYRIAKPEVASVIVGTGPADERGRFVRHPYLNYALRPNYVSADGKDRHNAQGMHDSQSVVVPKPAGQYRIVAIGGSTTYGVGMRSSEDAYPAQLERVLQEVHHLANVRVVNLGVPGYNSWESLVNLEFRGLDLDPDLVINYDGINDVHARIVRPDRYLSDDSGHRRQWDTSALDVGWLDSRSYLVRFVAMHLARLKPPRIEEVVWQPDMPRRPVEDTVDPRLGMRPSEALQANPPKYFRRNLMDMVTVQRARGGETLLLTFATQPDLAAGNEKYAASPAYRAAVAEQNDLVRALAGELKTPLVDMAKQMPQNKAYWQGDGIHLTQAGNRHFAEILALAIAPRIVDRRRRAGGSKPER